MNILCKIKHNFIRMPEPNEIKMSVRICKRCGLTQTFNPHGFHGILQGGHWMEHMMGLDSLWDVSAINNFKRENNITAVYKKD
jgi:hypothetical protein